MYQRFCLLTQSLINLIDCLLVVIAGKSVLMCTAFHNYWINKFSSVLCRINPPDLDPSLMWRTRYFVIKSNSTRHVMLSMQHGVRCSTQAGNDCLNRAFLSMQQPSPASLSSASADADNAPSASEVSLASGVLLAVSQYGTIRNKFHGKHRIYVLSEAVQHSISNKYVVYYCLGRISGLFSN